MRLVRISAPAGKGSDVARIAFDCGIKSVSIQHAAEHKLGAKPKEKDVVDMRVATPEAHAMIAALVAAPFFNREEYAVDVREPRAFLRSGSVREITRPLAAPVLDIDQELWQFAQVTPSFVLRVLIAAAVLAYGMVHDNLLLMAGGLLFLPLLPLLLGVSMGALTRQWGLVAQALAAGATATLLIVGAAAAVGAATEPPIMFDNFPRIVPAMVLSLLIAIAAALATADDAGHRQLVGLAAASQIALVPAWIGLSLAFGFAESPAEKLWSFALNAGALVAGSMAAYGLLKAWEARRAADSAKYQNRPRSMRHASKGHSA